MKGLRTFFMLFVSLVIVVAFAAAAGITAEAPKTKKETKAATKESAPAAKTTFKWIPAKAGVTKAQVSIGRSVVCPFEFGVSDAKTAKVKLSIKEANISKMGIIVADEEVTVTGGKAASSAMFSIPGGTRLGNYELTVVAKNAATGAVIGEGKIPFQVMPKGAGGC
ncbi:MAG: hypothetical protein HZC11_00585 [Nitrospirae bacterium]|nr:hypothetical protein [Nitrospirota bacterium]